MNKKTIKDIVLNGKRVFIRVDFNVPIKDGKITDDTRIRGAIPTIQYASDNAKVVVLASHLGRPLKDKKKAEEKGVPYDSTKYSLKAVAEHLSELIGKEVKFASDCIGEGVKKLVDSSENGEIILLENVRYHPGEEKNEEEFAKQLAELADVYVNDAFGAAHRAHASTAGITKFVEDSVAGFLMEKELEFLGKALNNP
ncbi:MAG TPA: phosphoglycerate kinase, partial [Pyrinomonadaceae bacterium]|nr:phosphoglycerate kinase [Pyrinomonadaceae bacterium]